MKLFWRLAFLAAMIALGLWLWTVFFPVPEKVIRHRLEKLAADASFTADQGNLSRLAGGENVAGYFSTNIEININVPGQEQVTLAGRAEITQAVLGVRERLKSLSVKFPDINITLAPNKKSAVADVTLDAAVSDKSDAVVQELKISFQKIEGVWLIIRIETVRTVAAPRFTVIRPLTRRHFASTFAADV
ncbi:MAG TPA: hypothetical protein VMV89_13240 [Candidatus Paceibacterota bacterium]|nr:hypothetical protein [Candidatus Paceibacterota bacterium]